MAFYQHEPLESPDVQLRLTILHPAKSYSSIHCDLIQVTPELLEGYEVKFDALSYCWGQGAASNTIFIDGKAHQVTPNLEHALRALRRKDAQRLLWIDAICIDQRSLAERNAQVPRMGWIYTNAVEVVIWIGRDMEREDNNIRWDPSLWPSNTDISAGSSSKTFLAFQFLRNLAWFSREKMEYNTNVSLYIKLLDMCKSADYCANVMRLLRREWFERVWVIQEVVLAKKATVVCGSQSIPWSELEGASKAMVHYEITNAVSTTHPFFTIVGRDRISRVVDCRTRRRIFPLLEATQASRYATMALYATNPRDKLYGVMGMLPLEDVQDIKVDYDHSLIDVYRLWVEARIRRTGVLDPLSLCANTARRGFPSWVPDLTHRLPQDQNLFSITHSISPGVGAPPPSTIYNASGSAQAKIQSSSRTIGSRIVHELNLRGVQVGIIDFLAPEITQDVVPPSGDLQDILGQLEDMLLSSDAGKRRMRVMLKSKSLGQCHKQLLEEFGTTIFRGYAHTNIDCSMTRMYQCFRGRSVEPSLQITTWPPTQPQELYSNFANYIRAFLWYSRYFVTSQGYFGVVSDNCNVKVGDELWILAGGKTPFVLRRARERSAEYGDDDRELFGPCYISTYMTGSRFMSSAQGKKASIGSGNQPVARHSDLFKDLILV
jgi:hypothetical protein